MLVLAEPVAANVLPPAIGPGNGLDLGHCSIYMLADRRHAGIRVLDLVLQNEVGVHF